MKVSITGVAETLFNRAWDRLEEELGVRPSASDVFYEVAKDHPRCKP